MTITVKPTRNEYIASASQAVFTYTFKIFEDTDINVYVTPSGQVADDTTDEVTVLSVTGVGNEDGGTVTIDAVSSGDLVTLVSDIPESRTTDYQNNGDFRPTVVNEDFDRVVSLVKQVVTGAERTLLFPESQQNPQQRTLPNPEAGKLMRWKGDLSGLENVEVTTEPIGTNVGSIGGLRNLDINDFSAGDSVFVDSYSTAGDGGGGPRRILFTGASVGFYVDNGSSVIVPTGGDGSAAWLWLPEVTEVNTIGDLREQVGFYDGQRCVLLGYTTVGDGNAGPERTWIEGASAGTYVDNGGSIIVPTGGDGSAAWLIPKSNVYDISWFGADSTRVLDSTSAIQATIDYCATLSYPSTIQVGIGAFKLSSTLFVSTGDIRIKGFGPNSQLYRASNYGHTILVSAERIDTGVTTSITRVYIEDISIFSATLPTHGAHIYMIAAAQGRVSKVLLRGGIYQGIHVKGGQRTSLLDVQSDLTDGLYPGVPLTDSSFITTTRNGSGATNYALPHVGNFRIENADMRLGGDGDTTSAFVAGLDIRSSDGIWIDSCYIKNCQQANYLFSPGDDYSTLLGAKLHNSWGDSSALRGVEFSGEPTNATFAYNEVVNFTNWGSTSVQAYGIYLDSSKLNWTSFINCVIFNLEQAGVFAISFGNKITFNDLKLFNCCTAATVTDSVIDINANLNYFTITNCKLGSVEDGVITGSSDYGIKVRFGTSDNYIITNNDLTGNITAGLTDLGSGTNKVVANNIS